MITTRPVFEDKFEWAAGGFGLRPFVPSAERVGYSLGLGLLASLDAPQQSNPERE